MANKVTRTVVESTIITGYPVSNPENVVTFECKGTCADPSKFGKKVMKLSKTDAFVPTEVKETVSKYEMDIDTFIANATKIEA